MLKLLSVFAVAGVGLAAMAAAVSAQGQTPPTELKVGDQAPPFALQGSDGKVYRLSDAKGKTVVLAWFVRAFTGG